MEKKQYEGLDITVFEEVLNNGLRVYLCKLPLDETYAKMTVSTGLAVNKFTFDGKEYEVSPHTAHFLEHILFNKEDGDLSYNFLKNSSQYNATTSLDETKYWFLGYNNFYDNLKTLLRIVSEPFFTEEGISKEKEYIQTEIKGKLIQIAYKEKIQNLENLSFDYAMMKIYLSKKLSVLSNLKDITEKDDNYITPYVYYSLDVMDGYYVIQNYVKVKEEKDAASILTADLQNKKITRDDFELLKKYQIISLLKKLDYPVKIGDLITSQIKLYKKPLYNIYMIYKNLKYEDFLDYINNLSFANKSVIVYEKEI